MLNLDKQRKLLNLNQRKELAQLNINKIIKKIRNLSNNYNNSTYKKLHRNIVHNNSIVCQFKSYICVSCPHNCTNCDFCCTLFMLIPIQQYEKMLEEIVKAFYYNIDVSSFSFAISNLCPICPLNCVTNGKCVTSYLRQFSNLFNNKITNKVTLNCENALINRWGKSYLDQQIPKAKNGKPYITVAGSNMSKVVNKIWKLNENNNQEIN